MVDGAYNNDDRTQSGPGMRDPSGVSSGLVYRPVGAARIDGCIFIAWSLDA